jgi:CRP-like cAMP-binding protein
MTTVRAGQLTRLAFRELLRARVGLYARFQMLVAQQLASDIRRADAALGQALEHALGHQED